MQACFWSELNRASGKAKTTSFLMLSLLLLLRPWKAFFHISSSFAADSFYWKYFCDFCSFLLLECSFFACVMILIKSKLLHTQNTKRLQYYFQHDFLLPMLFFLSFHHTYPKFLWMFEPLLLCYILLPMTKNIVRICFWCFLFCFVLLPTLLSSSLQRYDIYPVIQ